MPAPAGMNAYIFRIDFPDDRRQAVVCVEPRYLSLLAAGQRKPERRELSETSWRELARELAHPLPAAPLPRHAAVVAALVEPEARATATVRYVAVMPIKPSPDDLGRRLDALHVGFGGLHLSGKLGWS